MGAEDFSDKGEEKKVRERENAARIVDGLKGREGVLLMNRKPCSVAAAVRVRAMAGEGMVRSKTGMVVVERDGEEEVMFGIDDLGLDIAKNPLWSNQTVIERNMTRLCSHEIEGV